MKVALVYPPTADPTAPYVSVPLLAACLRRAGFDVLAIDANARAWSGLLDPGVLKGLSQRVRARLRLLDGLETLGHAQQLEYAALWDALPAASRAPRGVAEAVATLRDPARFFDAFAYERAVGVIDEAAVLVGAAHFPLTLDFGSYRTPFSLLTPDEIRHDAHPSCDPFAAYWEALAAFLAAERVGMVGVSVAFPGQLQPAFSMAYALRARLPDVHLAAGGPALTQLLAHLPPDRAARMLGPFHSAVLFEGDEAIVDLARAVAAGRAPSGVMRGAMAIDLSDLPAPDFQGVWTGHHLAPSPVLPYDPSRGCWWGRCAFCHYGLAEAGTARFRERPADRVAADVAVLAREFGCRIVYFSNDSLSPRLASAIAARLSAQGVPVRWASDMRPEAALDEARCLGLAAGGCLAASLGIESGDARVLALIDKGVTVPTARGAIAALAGAGIAVEAMTFTGFPTETTAEALRTLRLVGEEEQRLALFICGEFALTRGSRVARDPAAFGVAEVWGVDGDEAGTGVFWRPARTLRRDDGRVDDAVEALSRRWHLRAYPWAGSLSTAHTLLWYDRFGPGVFRDLARVRFPPPPRVRLPRTRFDPQVVAETSADNEGAIWHELTHVLRRVSRPDYDRLAAAIPPLAAKGAAKGDNAL